MDENAQLKVEGYVTNFFMILPEEVEPGILPTFICRFLVLGDR